MPTEFRNEPFTDFTINADGTLALLEATRQFCPDATFIFTSTNKVYGDTPNNLPLIELDTRWEVDPTHHFAEHGIDERQHEAGHVGDEPEERELRHGHGLRPRAPAAGRPPSQGMAVRCG
jgi:GDP-D-mannose dehydratase